jgi:predicted transcriptional regulator
MLRQLCSTEKIRIIQAIRHEKPVSVYGLARKLGRGFKAVRQDLELLRHFGIVALVKESGKNSKRQRLRPVLALNKLQLNIQL